MSFDGKLFFVLADELINKQQNSTLHEAYFRTSISRSYYYAFWIARKLVTIPPNKTNVHRYVIDELIDSYNKDKKKLGYILDSLRMYRIDSDYNEDKKIKAKDAKQAYTEADRILKLIDSIEE